VACSDPLLRAREFPYRSVLAEIAMATPSLLLCLPVPGPRETLPGPDQCWLEHEGARYTSELRLVAVDRTRRGWGNVRPHSPHNQ